MATSGSFDFSLSRTQLLDDVLITLGILRVGDTIENHTTMETFVVRQLNTYIKSLQNTGLKLWSRKQTNIVLQANKTSYSWKYPGGDINIVQPVRVIRAFRRDAANTDVKMTILEQSEYDNLSSKMSNGTPTQWYYDEGLTQGTWYLWPTPTTTGANVVVTYHQPFDDMDSNTDTFDFPQRWYNAIKWGFLLEICTAFGREPSPTQEKLAVYHLGIAQNEGYEEGSVYIKPSSRRIHFRFRR